MDVVMGCLADIFLPTQECAFLTAPMRPGCLSKEHEQHYQLAERKTTFMSPVSSRRKMMINSSVLSAAKQRQ